MNFNNSPLRNYNSPIRSPAAPPMLPSGRRVLSSPLPQQQGNNNNNVAARQVSNSPSLMIHRPNNNNNSPVRQQGNNIIGGSRPSSPIVNQLHQQRSNNNNNGNPPASSSGASPVIPIRKNSFINSHYFPKSELGRGSFGVVHLCRVTSSGMVRLMTNFASVSSSSSTSSSKNNNKDINNNNSIPHEVVVKSVRLTHLDKRMKDLSIQEVSALMKLRQNKKIVRVLDAWVESSGSSSSPTTNLYHDNPLCIALEYCQGGSLDEYIRSATRNKPGACSPATAVSIAMQLFQGLEFIHQNKLLHRDIKPANVFLRSKLASNQNNNNNNNNNLFRFPSDENSEYNTSIISDDQQEHHQAQKNIQQMDLVLGDLGIARVLDHTCAHAMTKIGTPLYMAPENCNGAKYSYPSDVWAVGVILYEIVCGMRPFTAHGADHPGALMMRIINQDPIPNLFKKCSSSGSGEHHQNNKNDNNNNGINLMMMYPVELLNLVKSCLEKDQFKRPTATQALEILNDVVQKYRLPVGNHVLKTANNSKNNSNINSPTSSSLGSNANNINNNNVNNSRSPSTNLQQQQQQQQNVSFARSPSPIFRSSGNIKDKIFSRQNSNNNNNNAMMNNNKKEKEDSSSPYQPPAPASSPVFNPHQQADEENHQQQHQNRSPSSLLPPITSSNLEESLLYSCRSFVQTKLEQNRAQGSKLQQKIGFCGCLALASHRLIALQLQKQQQRNNNENNIGAADGNQYQNNHDNNHDDFKFTPIRVRAALTMLSCSDIEAQAYLRQASLEQIGQVCELANEVFLS